MNARRSWLIALTLGICEPTVAADTPVSFSKEIAPILIARCLDCHGAGKAKGSYRLHTFAHLLEPGASDERPVVPGQPEASKLLQLVTTDNEDDRMPQKSDPLPRARQQLIERWIREGAKFDGASPDQTLVSLAPPLHPQPPEKYPAPVPITALAFSHDGQELAASGYHEITVWNPADGALVRRITNVAQQTHALLYLPAHGLIAAASGTPGRLGEIRLFNATNGQLARVLVTSDDAQLTVALSPNGQQLAGAGADGAIRLFEIETGRQQLVIEQHADWVTALAFSPDGKHIASASRDKSARVYRADTGEMESSYQEHGDGVFAIAFSADGKRVYSGGRDRRVHCWNPENGKKDKELSGIDSEISRLLIAGTNLFVCTSGKAIRCYSTTSRELVRTCSGHRDVVYALAFDAANGRLASGSYDGEIRVWNTDTGETMQKFVAAPGR